MLQKNSLLFLAAGLIGAFGLNLGLSEYVTHQIAADRSARFGSERSKGVHPSAYSEGDPAFAAVPEPVAFEEHLAFDDDGYSWSNIFSSNGAAGAAIFDANGDGRLDVYLTHDGQNWTRPTDADGILTDEARHQANTLYLNLGNDPEGRPIFSQVSDLVLEGDPLARQELLVEDYLEPRNGPGDSEARWGRTSNTAVAADFNGDGLVDLLVGNEPKGIMWTHDQTRQVLNPLVDPVNRKARRSKLPLSSLAQSFIEYTPSQGVDDTRESGRGVEPEGANSLYLNLGDQDGDGVPEWRDATVEAGIAGRRATYGFTVADIDLDGDLDVYAASVMDMDFWSNGAHGWAGGTNELFVNQLAETGELRFEERAAEYDVDGVFDDDNPMPTYLRLRRLPLLPEVYSIATLATEPFQPEPLEIDGEFGEQAEISWATVFQDVDEDGYPDLWVANDIGFLRLYMNKEGKGFEERPHAREGVSGSWMTLAPADFNGDLREDLLAGNLGGAVLNHSFLTIDPYRLFDPTMGDMQAVGQFFGDRHDWTHALIDGASPTRELPLKVRHSKVLPPDAALPNNQRRFAPDPELQVSEMNPETLDPYEFSWGMTAFDAQNDGRMDLYWVGCMFSRGGGLFPILGTGPGRLLVNATGPSGELRFTDLTAEHQVFNINELDYSRMAAEGIIERPAPTKNWKKRDIVRSVDVSTWSAQGPSIQDNVTNQDLIQTSEQGRVALAADLNGDGFDDLLVTNLGGYDSRSSKATNLKTLLDGRPQVVPPPDDNYPTLTDYDPGRTRLWLNRYADNGWLRVSLVDDVAPALNRDAIGARVVLNGEQLRVVRASSGSYMGSALQDLTFGLGTGVADTLEVVWPDRERSTTTVKLNGQRNGTVVISRAQGFLDWQPSPPSTRAEAASKENSPEQGGAVLVDERG